jgi:hypothetical protein
MARSDPTDFVFTVLEGPLAGFVVPLNGWSAPFRGGDGGEISFGRQMRKRTVWYPGSKVGLQQIIGPKLEPTKINGYWPERYLGTDVPIDLVETFEAITDSGAQVRIDWETRTLVGTIGDFKWVPGDPVGGLTDITWSLTFDPVSEGDDRTPPRVQGQRANARDDLVSAATRGAEVAASIEAFVESVGSFVGLVNAGFQPDKRALEDLLTQVNQSVTQEATIAASMVDDIDLTPQAVNGAATTAAAAVYQLGEVSRVATDIFPAAVVVSDDLAAILNEAVARFDLSDHAIEAMEEQFSARVRFENQARPAAYVRVPAVVGMDLRDLAIDYYGNADLWFRIAERNGLDDSRIPDDIDEILIPLSLPESDDPRVGA